MTIDWSYVIEGVITVIVLIITTVLVPWIKSKVSSETLAQIEKWIKIAVQAAEMIFNESGMGEKKKAYVKDFLADIGINLEENQLNNMIESAVLEMNKNE